MELINPHQLSKRKMNELISSLGGKYSLLERLRLRGIGIGGLVLHLNENPKIPLQYKTAIETVKVSIEPYKAGLIIAFNNTKELKWYVAHQPKLTVSIEEPPNSRTRNGRAPLLIKLSLFDHVFTLRSSGWNNQSVIRYFEKLPKLMGLKSQTR